MLPLIGRLVFSLAVVIALMLGCAALLPRSSIRGGGRGRAGALAVTSRAALGRNVAVAVVRAAGRAFLVGVSEHGVTLLGEVDAAALDAADDDDDRDGERTRLHGATRPRPARKGLLDALRERTVRRS